MTDTSVLERSDAPDPAPPEPADETTPAARRVDLRAALERGVSRVRHASPQTWVTGTVVAAACWFAFHNVHPVLVFTDTTPTGGDMGAHVWGPNFLLHEVLPRGRLTGWAPDWYAGFPAYQFYMVVPSLLIVALHVGVRSILVVPAVAVSLAVAGLGYVAPAWHRWRRPLLGLGVLMVVLSIPVPYNIAFKLVTVSGLVSLPLAAWAFGKLTDLPFPGPPLLSVAALFFLYNREPLLNSGTGNIIGGNMASTMAGEFAFSISVSLCLLYLGVLIRGLRTGRHSASAAVLLAMCGLCHIIPVFFALFCTVVALVVYPGWSRLRWLTPVLVVAGLLSAFWVVPFALRHAFVNDMGWDRLPAPGAKELDGVTAQTVWSYLTPDALTWPLMFAAVGLMVTIVFRWRPGLVLAVGMTASAAAFCWLPQARLWNARVLPFYYLTLFLLAGVGVSQLIRAVGTLTARDPEQPRFAVTAGGLVACALAAGIFLGVPLGRMPGTTYPASGGVSAFGVQGDPTWAGWLGLHRDYRNDVPGWAKWNFEGLERKPVAGPGAKVPEGQGGWPEFRAMVATMADLGADPDHGCGRAFWEYGERLNTYGTPMAPMLLPYFTDGCIGSMEGLYFESSATTPYHFLVQCELSDKGSCAQRDMAYRSRDFPLGVSHIEQLGVKYYMAFSDWAVEQAAADPRLTEVAVAGPWHVYQLAPEPSALVVPLENEPVVMTTDAPEPGILSRVVGAAESVLDGRDDTALPQDVWLDPSAAWFLNRDGWDVLLAEDGPPGWARVEVPQRPEVSADGTERRFGDFTLPDLPATPVDPVVVSDISTDTDRISFTVDQVGSPVLVKTSSFPNWRATGADGPYRVAPNLMVVVPTATEVTLHYDRTSLDWLAMVLTLVGLVGLVGLVLRKPVAMPEPHGWFAPPAPAPPTGETPQGDGVAGPTSPWPRGEDTWPTPDAIWPGPVVDDPIGDCFPDAPAGAVGDDPWRGAADPDDHPPAP